MVDIREMLKGTDQIHEIGESQESQVAIKNPINHDGLDAPCSDLTGSESSLNPPSTVSTNEQPITAPESGHETDAASGSDSDSTIDAPRDEQTSLLKVSSMRMYKSNEDNYNCRRMVNPGTTYMDKCYPSCQGALDTIPLLLS